MSDLSATSYCITLIVTEDCNLHCNYCFEHNKSRRYMTFETAKAALDQLLKLGHDYQDIIIEFSGGEPLLNFDLITRVFNYARGLKLEGKRLNFQIGTNGTLLTDAMKRWFENHACVSLGLSLDGTREIHNTNRDGSYDEISKNFTFFRRYNNSVKMTISPSTIGHLAECVEHIHGLGFTLEANVVFEDVWGSPLEKSALLRVFADELVKLVNFYDRNEQIKPPFLIDAMIESLLYPDEKPRRFCGAGRSMVTVAPNGKFYPCHRFAPISTASSKEVPDISPIPERVTPKRCRDCRVRSLCHSCLGYNYEINGDIDVRTTHHCEFVKLQLKASAMLRYRRVMKYLEGNYASECHSVRAMAVAINYIENSVESIAEIISAPLRGPAAEAEGGENAGVSGHMSVYGLNVDD